MTRTNTIALTATTTLFGLAILPGAILDIVQPDFVVQMSGTLGIPLSMLTLIGVWKLLGVAALLTPGVRRLKEWAYAGFLFDLTGAAFLHAAAGDYAGVPVPLALTGLLMVSYMLRRKADGTVTSTDDDMSRAEQLSLAGA